MVVICGETKLIDEYYYLTVAVIACLLSLGRTWFKISSRCAIRSEGGVSGVRAGSGSSAMTVCMNFSASLTMLSEEFTDEALGRIRRVGGATFLVDTSTLDVLNGQGSPALSPRVCIVSLQIRLI